MIHMAASRKFNGITYSRIAITDKRKATQIAAGVRGEGHLARVVETDNGKHAVYMKSKHHR